MALISSNNTKRLIPPHEPESWFDCRPIRAGDFEMLTIEGSEIKLSLDLGAALITAWSYDEPVTRETVGMLDVDTFLWLSGVIFDMSGVRDNAEKKDSEANSSKRQRRAQVSLAS